LKFWIIALIAFIVSFTIIIPILYPSKNLTQRSSSQFAHNELRHFSIYSVLGRFSDFMGRKPFDYQELLWRILVSFTPFAWLLFAGSHFRWLNGRQHVHRYSSYQ